MSSTVMLVSGQSDSRSAGMKILWLLVVVAAMLAGISGIAKADPVDYKIGGLDPLAGPGFAIVVPNEPFPLTFLNDCGLFGLSDDGCFFGFNASLGNI